MRLFTFLFFIPVIALASETSDRLSCIESGSQWDLVRLPEKERLDTHKTQTECEKIRAAANGGVVCLWFTPEMPVGPGGWNETGWRPANVDTKLGLGRRPMLSQEDCLSATRAAAGGVVCTNTGLGAKAAHTTTNMWCGASSQLKYCLIASAAALDHVVCSFPSDGTGTEKGWVRTRITDQCDYQGSQQSLPECNASIKP